MKPFQSNLPHSPDKSEAGIGNQFILKALLEHPLPRCRVLTSPDLITG